jgi:hypothetical protein
LLIASIAGGRAGEWVFALAAVAFPVLLIGFATRRARPVLALLLLGSATGVLVLSNGAGGAQAWLGLPAATWWMLVGLGILPLLLVVVSHGFGGARGRAGRR